MILASDGIPVAPTEIVRRIQQIDPRLDLKWLSGVGSRDYWALIVRWRGDDPRHQLIRSGDMDPGADYDFLCQLPIDCRVDDAYGYVVNGLKRASTAEIASMLQRVHAYNKEANDANWRPVTEPAFEAIDQKGSKLFGSLQQTVKVFGPGVKAMPAGKKGKRKK